MNFRIPIIVLVLGVGLAYVLGGWQQAMSVAILAVLEVSLSFDNAIMNATVLRRMSAFWQRMFMTVGLLVAVAGMRLLFPIVIVAATARIGFGAVIDLALHHPGEYAHVLVLAHPAIAAFGGMFLLMVFLDFLIDETKQVHWIARLEQPLARAGRVKSFSVLVALVALLAVTYTWAGNDSTRVASSGAAGLATYLVVRGLSRRFEHLSGAGAPGRVATGRAALSLFIYLEVLDASFSFDGVVGAFAITNNVLIIAFGLGIGALFMRELTVWLVRRDTLRAFVYLEHGVHYAVGALAVLLAVGLAYDVPEAVTGLIGAAFIGAALLSSLAHRKQRRTGRG